MNEWFSANSEATIVGFESETAPAAPEVTLLQVSLLVSRFEIGW